MSGAERIAAAFSGAADRGRSAALMPYLMGGYPDLATGRAIGQAYVDGGADLIELGVPYSDPLADGPVIHAAGTAALDAGASFLSVLDTGRELSGRVPVVLMCYSNLVYARGVDAFVELLAVAGLSGLIVPDLPLEEAPEFRSACDERGLALVPLVAPSTPDERLARIGELARGFLYTVSVAGTTGERSGPADGLAGVIERAKSHTDVPVAVGFGISTPEHATATAEAGADGVIIGSRLVREAGEAADPAEAVRELVAAMADALAAR
ncbi:MAG: tryptophan synthase subunit alpha [Solirubrobacteraceae bacterium]